MVKRFFLVLLVTLCVDVVSAQTLRFANAFSDGAVLQHSSTVNVWGWDVPDRDIRVECSWNDEIYHSRTDVMGRWIVEIKTLEPSFTEHSITVSSSTQQRTIENVLFGEVWFCSGQSNMEMRMGDDPEWELFVEGAAQEIANSENRNIRYLNVKRNESFTQQSEVATTGWLEFTPQSVEWVSAVAYFYAKELYQEINIPIGIIVNAYGGTPIEAWIPRSFIDEHRYSTQLDKLFREYSRGDARPYYKTISGLYNAMIHPFIDYGIRGWIWYQGEENVGSASAYPSYFQDLVASWRKAWGGELKPFYFVQIAPWLYTHDKEGQWSALAVAQQAAADAIENCEMVVAADLGDPYNIHPKYKRQVGQRLAKAALNQTYGLNHIEFKAPRAISAKVINYHWDVVIEFDNADGLHLINEEIEFEYFNRNNNRYQRAERVWIKQGQLIVRCGQGAEVGSIRYCWGDGSSSNLFNGAGLSSSPFEIVVQ